MRLLRFGGRYKWRNRAHKSHSFDAYDFCDYYKNGKIGVFSVAMLKTILHHFEVLFRAKDRNADLIRLVKDVIHECRCFKKWCLIMILGRRRGRRPAGYQLLQKDFLSAPAVFSSFTHVSVSHIMAKFDIKCMFFNFFRWESIRYRQTAYLLLYASSMKNFQFRSFLCDNIYFLPHLVEHIKAIFKKRNFFEIL